MFRKNIWCIEAMVLAAKFPAATHWSRDPSESECQNAKSDFHGLQCGSNVKVEEYISCVIYLWNLEAIFPKIPSLNKKANDCMPTSSRKQYELKIARAVKQQPKCLLLVSVEKSIYIVALSHSEVKTVFKLSILRSSVTCWNRFNLQSLDTTIILNSQYCNVHARKWSQL